MAIVLLVALTVASTVAVAVAAAPSVAVHCDHGDHEHDPQPVGGKELNHNNSFREGRLNHPIRRSPPHPGDLRNCVTGRY